MQNDKGAQEDAVQTVPETKGEIESQAIKEEEQEDVPPEIAEAIHRLPPNDRKKIQSFFASMVSVRSFGPAPNPLLAKMTPGHVDKVLDHIAEERKRDSEEKRATRKYGFWYFIVSLVAFFSLIFLLVAKDQQGLLDRLVVAFLGFLGGFGIGKTKK